MYSYKYLRFGHDSTRIELPPMGELGSRSPNRPSYEELLPPINNHPDPAKEARQLPSLPSLTDYLTRKPGFAEQHSVEPELALPKLTSFGELYRSLDPDEERLHSSSQLNESFRLPPIASRHLHSELPDPPQLPGFGSPLVNHSGRKHGEYLCSIVSPASGALKKGALEHPDETKGMERLAQRLADQRLSGGNSLHTGPNTSFTTEISIIEATEPEELLSRKRSWDQDQRQSSASTLPQWSRERRHSIAIMSSPSSPVPTSSLQKKANTNTTNTAPNQTVQPLTLLSPSSTHFPDSLAGIQVLPLATEARKIPPSLCATAAKNHACSVTGCNMRFKRLEHLKRHLRVHTMERPYACTYTGCRKTFSRRDNLGQHLRTHQRQEAKAHFRQSSM